MKAISISVYVKKRGENDLFFGDCTNGGISSKYNNLLLICDDGYIEIDENNIPENAVRIVTRTLWGKEYKHIEPLKQPNKGNIGWMNGGNVAYTSDSRFKSDYPLNIHDRQETQEQYDALSC